MLLAVLIAVGWIVGDGLRPLRRPSFWVIILSIVILGAFCLDGPEAEKGPFGFSLAGAQAGFSMAIRAAILVMAFSVSLKPLTPSEFIRIFGRLGVPGAGLALGVALNLAPVIQNTVESAYHTIRLRGGFRRPFLALRLFIITTVANSLRYGDDVVNAATARAFDPTSRMRAEEALTQRGDRFFIASLLLAGAGLCLFPV